MFEHLSDDRFDLLSGAYIDMLLRSDMWRFHARKMYLGQQIMIPKTAMEKQEEIVKREKAKEPDAVPGFMYLGDWLSSQRVHTALGLDHGNDQSVPIITCPPVGGCWGVEMAHMKSD